MEEGLVTRTDDPDDRRSHRIAVTPEGAALVQATRQRKTAYLAEALEGLSVQEQRTLSDAAAILARVLEQDGR